MELLEASARMEVSDPAAHKQERAICSVTSNRGSAEIASWVKGSKRSGVRIRPRGSRELPSIRRDEPARVRNGCAQRLRSVGLAGFRANAANYP